jgi:hypothetical protein
MRLPIVATGLRACWSTENRSLIGRQGRLPLLFTQSLTLAATLTLVAVPMVALSVSSGKRSNVEVPALTRGAKIRIGYVTDSSTDYIGS